MSLSIGAISKAKRVKCTGVVDEEADLLCDHDEVADCPIRGDHVKRGCYEPGKGGRRFSFEIWYKAYSDWMREICRFALGVEWDEACNGPRRFRDKPFFEVIDFPYSSDGQIHRDTTATVAVKCGATMEN